MLTKLTIRNFKRFESVEIPLANPVVFAGPNNSGKTSALQALALWELGLRRWKEKSDKREKRGTPEKRPGVAINRKDLLMVPAPAANQFWRALHVRSVQRVGDKPRTENIRIEILVEGTTGGRDWRCGLEFDFSNDEAFFCRPLRQDSGKNPARMAIPDDAYSTQVAFLPPMSGLASRENRLEVGTVNSLLGEGRTAEVLRNLCHHVAVQHPQKWDSVVAQIQDLFGVSLEEPKYVAERGELEMSYKDEAGTRLDLSCSGRGLQQTLLLLTYLALHPHSVLLLDEPDAHLELLRQAEIYQLLIESARASDSQILIASHSEELLNRAADAGEANVVVFLGSPHRLAPGRSTAVRQSLSRIRWDQYYKAEQAGWVLYLEGTTDLDVLRALASQLGHRAGSALRCPFLCAIGNDANYGRMHFNALVEAKPDLQGFLLVDRDAKELQTRDNLKEMKWPRRELENYICQPETLESFAKKYGTDVAVLPIWAGQVDPDAAVAAMRKVIKDRVPPAALRNPDDAWWSNVKASDDFLDLVFPEFFRELGLRPDVSKADYYSLVRHIPVKLISQDVLNVLEAIAIVAERVHPAGAPL